MAFPLLALPSINGTTPLSDSLLRINQSSLYESRAFGIDEADLVHGYFAFASVVLQSVRYLCLSPYAYRYNERSTVERDNGRLKDEFGGRMVRVQGAAQIMTHLMFGMIALTLDQLMRFSE